MAGQQHIQSLAQRIAPYFRENACAIGIAWGSAKGLVLLLVACGLVRGTYWPLLAFLSRDIVDAVVNHGGGVPGGAKLGLLLALYFVVFAANRVWWPLYSCASTLALSRISRSIREAIAERAARLGLAFYDDPEAYDRLQRAVDETAGRRPVQMVDRLVGMVCTIFSLLLMLLPLVARRPLLGALLVLTGVPAVWLDRHFGHRLHDFERENTASARKLSYILDLFTSRTSAAEIRVHRTGDYLRSAFSALSDAYLRGLRRVSGAKLLLSLPGWLPTAVCGGAAYFVLARDASLGAITLGDLTYFVVAIEALTQALRSVGSAYAGTVSARLSASSLRTYLDEEEHAQPATGAPLPSCAQYRISFKDVSFRYPGSSALALSGVSFDTVTPASVAVVGLNGAGKSTMVKLLTRLYEPTEGAIYCNDMNIATIDIEAWRALFSVCFQNSYAYAFSARVSIGLGNLSRLDDATRVEAAAREAGVDGVLRGLARGFDTCLSREFADDGVELSGGQFQRIAIARAFMGEGPFMVFDEPSASLDARAEHDLYAAMRLAGQDRLTLMVTHRLSSTARADKILVLDRGHLVECGTHEELMSQGGLYRELFDTQAKRYRSEAT